MASGSGVLRFLRDPLAALGLEGPTEDSSLPLNSELSVIVTLWENTAPLPGPSTGAPAP